MQTVSIISLILSASALTVSGFTAWFTLFRRGNIKMTRPRLVFFGWEKTPSGLRPKVFLRCLLFSTGKRGQVIQSMYLRVRRGSANALLSHWAYGERKELVPGSGLFVSQEGVAFNHHFLSSDTREFPELGFSAGEYRIQVYVDQLNSNRHRKLYEFSVTLSEEASGTMYRDEVGVLFDWNPDRQEYLAEVDKKPDPQALTAHPPLHPGL